MTVEPPASDTTPATGRWFLANPLIAVVALCGFAAIAWIVATQETETVEDRVLRWAHNAVEHNGIMRPERLEEIIRDWTALGGYACLTILIAGMTGYLLLTRRTHVFRVFMVSVVGGLALAMTMKATFQRPRPDEVVHKSNVSSSSFPSGHSMMSMVVYLTLGALLARISHTRALRIYCLAGAASVSVLVGCSRVFVGVHYPTDVLAGWLGGIFWVSVVCWYAQRLEDRGVLRLDR